MSTQRERRKAQMTAAAARRTEPDARAPGRTAIRSKPVRITLDLSPELYRQLTEWTASAAMTLDVYADLFDSDLSSVAESVGKMWAQQVHSQ